MNLKLAGRCFVFLWFFIGGICHFAIPAPFVSIVPPYVPFPLAAVYISGFFEIAGAIVLWKPPLRRLAAYGLILLTICVTPANVYMLMHAELFSAIPYWVLVVRLPFQLLLIWIIWCCNKLVTKD
jgi:uncharacterized membrane protein